ncbi:oligosaccharide flippase family protein [Halorussus sp. MSC15.2]|uniref:oligosaccharide flippase family protein n=1 Tax=Halorussus sp. MSC15.2 TaxID=2283638 RepID=UPI0013D2D3A7|nr:oligosaccharide flippase family protein [Halorussus sp. MSC15.2]NEU55905.1 polysaccharide biosynthesis protein [Halorussus sp. MSC15.2]
MSEKPSPPDSADESSDRTADGSKSDVTGPSTDSGTGPDSASASNADPPTDSDPATGPDASEVSFRVEVLKGATAKFLMFVVGLAGSMYMARAVGPAVYGGFYLLLSLAQFAARFTHGFAGASQKRLAETDTPNGEILGLTLGTIGLNSAVVAVGAAAFAGPLREYTGVADAPLLAVALFVAISTFVPMQFLLAGTGRVGVTNWIDLGRTAVRLPLQLTLVALGFGAAGMAGGLIAATAVCVPATLYCLGVRPEWPSRETAASVWSHARWNILTNLTGKAYTRFDVFLIGALVSASVVGGYEVALELTVPATILSNVILDGLLARVSNLASLDRDVGPEITRGLAYSSLLAVPVCGLALALARPAVTAVYGPEYASAAGFVAGLGVYRVVQTQREPLNDAAKALDRPDATFRVSVIALAVNIVVGVPLVWYGSALGAVAATIAAELVRWVLLHRVLAAEGATVSRVPTQVRSQFAAGATLVVAVLAVRTAVPVATTAWYGLAGLAAAGLVTYGTVLLAIDADVRGVARRTVGDVTRAARVARRWSVSAVRP